MHRSRGLFGSEDPTTDFGRTARARPAAVHRVGSVTDLRALLARLGDELPRPRARAHSVDGQTVTPGHLVDLSGLRGVDTPRTTHGRAHVRVEAGATWRDVLQVTLPRGWVPPVVVDHLDLTVGGTLSLGGLGATSWRHGLQADHVLRAVVCGPGGTSRAVRPGDPLLERVLCGQGRHGVLAEVTLELVRAPQALDRWTVTLDDHRQVLGLHEELLATGLPLWLDGGGLPAPSGGWGWAATVAVDASDTASAVVRERVEDRCRRWPGAEVTQDRPDLLAHLDRAGARLRADHDRGGWTSMAHPRTQLVLPREGGRPLLDRWLADPAVRELLGSGGVLLYALDLRLLRRLGVGVGQRPSGGPSDGRGFLVGWQRTCEADDADGIAAALAQGGAMAGEATRVGGVPYPVRVGA